MIIRQASGSLRVQSIGCNWPPIGSLARSTDSSWRLVAVGAIIGHQTALARLVIRATRHQANEAHTDNFILGES